MATITGAFGGLLRDVLCNEIPMILRKGQLYAVAVIVGASIYVLLLDLGISEDRPGNGIGQAVLSRQPGTVAPYDFHSHRPASITGTT